MAELSEFTVRLGKPNLKDRHSFLSLWQPFLAEHYVIGSDIPATDENLLECLRIYDSYTNGSLFGTVVLAFKEEDPAGAILVGEQPGGFIFRSERIGRTAFVWGAYVKPEYRAQHLGQEMCAFGVEDLRTLGFGKVRSMVVAGYPLGETNALSWGAHPVASVVERDITKPLVKGVSR